MLKFEKATKQSEFESIEALAKEIWQEHYANILTQAQIQYMINNFQSAQAIEAQVENGYYYLKIFFDGVLAGYFAFKEENDEKFSDNKKGVFLSKLYIKKSYRQKGIAKSVIVYLKDFAKKFKCNYIWLTVNKYNINSLNAYKKIGFEIYRENVVSIGEGYVMDDHYMKLEL